MELIATIDQLKRDTTCSEAIAAEMHAHAALQELSALVGVHAVECHEHIQLAQVAS